MPEPNFIDIFPAELLLEIIQRIPFDSRLIPTLALVHPRICDLVSNYQPSITKNFARSNLPHVFQDFPPPCKEGKITYKWLSECIQQYDIIDDVMAVLTSDLNCYAVEKHNMAVVNTGLLLLYKLCTTEDHKEKLALLNSLPQDPLTAIFLAVDYSTRTARYHGKGIINQGIYGRFLDANRLELRNDIEFCFSEGIMSLGPSFISMSLLNADDSETTLMCLYHDHALHDWDLSALESDFRPPVTQGPALNPETVQPSLYTTLLVRLAKLVGCALSEIVGRIIQDIAQPDHSLAGLSLAGKERLVRGLDLEYYPDDKSGNGL